MSIRLHHNFIVVLGGPFQHSTSSCKYAWLNSWKRHLLIPIQLRFLLSHWMHRCQGQCQRKARFGTSGRSNLTLTMMKVFLTCVYQTLLYCMTLRRKVQDMLGELGLSIVWCDRIGSIYWTRKTFCTCDFKFVMLFAVWHWTKLMPVSAGLKSARMFFMWDGKTEALECPISKSQNFKS